MALFQDKCSLFCPTKNDGCINKNLGVYQVEIDKETKFSLPKEICLPRDLKRKEMLQDLDHKYPDGYNGISAVAIAFL